MIHQCYSVNAAVSMHTVCDTCSLHQILIRSLIFGLTLKWQFFFKFRTWSYFTLFTKPKLFRKTKLHN